MHDDDVDAKRVYDYGGAAVILRGTYAPHVHVYGRVDVFCGYTWR